MPGLSEYIRMSTFSDKGGGLLSTSQRWHQLTKEETLSLFNVREGHGLSEAEARDRIEEIGENRLAEGKKVSPFVLLLNQFKDFMVLVLLAATLISGLLGEYIDAVTIIAIVGLNAVLGFFQEYRAEQSLQSLKELASPEATVLRDGVWRDIQASRLVPGDIVLLSSGDRIAADVRLLQTSRLQVEESALTGESVPVEKHDRPITGEGISLGDQSNMGFMGTMVVGGKGTGAVVATGMRTEMGKIADMLETAEEQVTPLQRKLEQLGKVLIGVAIMLTAVVVATGILHGIETYDMFLAGVSLAVAAIPEGLPAIVTIALALGVQRMIKRKAIVRKLPSVETLGCATVICSDKTGTLTQNKMTVKRLWTGGTEVSVTGQGYEPEGQFLTGQKMIDLRRHPDIRRLLQIGVLCNNARLVEQKANKKWFGGKKEWRVAGDPTEGALLVAGAKAGWYADSLSEKWQRVDELPFDSERKRMSVLFKGENGKRLVYAKGAPDVLLKVCTHILWQGGVRELTPTLKQRVLHHNETLAGMALRNLAFAYRDVTRESEKRLEQLEDRLIFVGLMGMIDPPREEVKEAIATCYEAGIKTVMITGDHQATAVAIARQLGILPRHGEVVSGDELARMPAGELARRVDNIYVYARVAPENKLKIVQALQEQGEVVAMTGDGVNDAPAIKAADIGIAMGITGTDVTKEAASLVLSDDNFATVVAAVEEGRGIYDNIRKFIRYLLASNVGEILVMFFAMLLAMPLPLVPIQILWVNLVTDGLPAMALGVDPQEEDTMRRRPRDSRESVFARGLGWKIVSRGMLIGLSTLGAFWLTLEQHPGDLVQAQTVAFATLVMAQLIHVFDCRSETSVFHRNIFENMYLIWAVISSFLLLFVVIYYEPLQPIFSTTAIGLREWSLILIAAGIPTFVAGIFPKLLFDIRQSRTAVH